MRPHNAPSPPAYRYRPPPVYYPPPPPVRWAPSLSFGTSIHRHRAAVRQPGTEALLAAETALTEPRTCPPSRTIRRVGAARHSAVADHPGTRRPHSLTILCMAYAEYE